MKNPVTPAGIEPVTFRFVAQHLNHCATAVPHVAEIRGEIKHADKNRMSSTVCSFVRTRISWKVYIKAGTKFQCTYIQTCP